MRMIQLGEEYRDSISGYVGVATGIAAYLNGCVKVLLEGPLNSKGELQELWFDEQRLAPGLDGRDPGEAIRASAETRRKLIEKAPALNLAASAGGPMTLPPRS